MMFLVRECPAIQHTVRPYVCSPGVRFLQSNAGYRFEDNTVLSGDVGMFMCFGYTNSLITEWPTTRGEVPRNALFPMLIMLFLTWTKHTGLSVA
jgi:hypothetical protein